MTNASMQLSSARIDYLRKRKKQKSKLHNYLLVFSVLAVLVFICLLIATIANFDHLFGQTVTDHGQGSKTDTLSPDDLRDVTVSSEDTNKGSLILINQDHTYPRDLTPANLVSIFDGRDQIKGTSEYALKVSNQHLLLTDEALSALNRMINDFYAATEESNTIVTAAYRSYQDQENSGSSIPAGQSDSHAGLSVCLKVYKGEKTYLLKDEAVAANYRWIYDNAHKYGFIVRYPDNKASVTGVSDYDYFFRYVGVEHAYYIHENDLCLEEYISLLHERYTAESPLEIRLPDEGKTYRVFYVPATKDTTVLRMTETATYSGDNAGGFIVSIPNN
ncbi:MAG: M15 family metallopeptidase [Clostridia bacterium]|nr:M15 family metallopeptidase [Clostridia bacterium]